MYFETLSLPSLLGVCLTDRRSRAALLNQSAVIYYIDVSRNGTSLALPLLRLLKIQADPLDFEMRNVKDERGELLRLRIFRHDLFELKKKILASESFKALYRQEWEQDGVLPFLEKGVIDGQIMDPFSVSRMVYLVGVVKWHATLAALAGPVLVVRRRPWFDVLTCYASEHGVRVVAAFVPLIALRRLISNAYYSIPRVYAFFRSVKEYDWPKLRPAESGTSVKIYVEGRGQVNLHNDGHHSDFYWLLNSQCSPRSIVYRPCSAAEKAALIAADVGVATAYLGSIFAPCRRISTKLRGVWRLRTEQRSLNAMLKSYNAIRTFWRAVFVANNVKIFLTWYRFEKSHIAIGDAVKDVGGVSVCLPISFDGFKSTDLFTKLDIAFCYSAFAANIEHQCGVKSDYRIITGYPQDYAPPLLKAEAVRLRDRLQAAGARKIVFVIDENSVDDPRWHTGHALQRENYSFILEQVLATPWLGVVFKPKVARTLRHRLGPVAQLLAEAEATGRCYVYEATSRDVTSAPPVLAGLSADVCIHAHLCSGTAALECALAGLPTLLIDREGAPDSKFYELPRGKVVFRDWPEAIAALMEHFERPGGIPNFGDWSPVIDQLDPFRDGLAARRIGDYLSWLQQGFEQGLDRDAVMLQAAERYGREWGADTVYAAAAPPTYRPMCGSHDTVCHDA